jgi:hypothetical protein
MNLTEEEHLQMRAHEAFIRRAAEIDFPFMLKGSYITRQYMANPFDRYANDLDWVGMETFLDLEDAKSRLDNWVIAVTELFVNDGVKFQSFKENAFWRGVEYAMADDFPTVNTDIMCWVNGKPFSDFSMDVSFNLDLEPGAVPLLYKPLEGEPFTIKNTCPLSLQVSWKLHQTIVRPRYKDIFDLIHLLQHPSFDSIMLNESMQALVNECNADEIDVRRLNWFISEKAVNYTRYTETGLSLLSMDFLALKSEAKDLKGLDTINFDFASWVSPAPPPTNHSDLLEHFRLVLNNAGFTSELLNHLPKPTRQKRKSYFAD